MFDKDENLVVCNIWKEYAFAVALFVHSDVRLISVGIIGLFRVMDIAGVW